MPGAATDFQKVLVRNRFSACNAHPQFSLQDRRRDRERVGKGLDWTSIIILPSLPPPSSSSLRLIQIRKLQYTINHPLCAFSRQNMISQDCWVLSTCLCCCSGLSIGLSLYMWTAIKLPIRIRDLNDKRANLHFMIPREPQTRPIIAWSCGRSCLQRVGNK